jgi:hypothetical protein
MRTITGLIALSALCFTLHVQAGDDETDRGRWALAKDISEASNQISFNQGLHGVWYFMESTSLRHDPLVYKFMSDYDAPCQGNPAALLIDGLSCWQDPTHTVDRNLSIFFNFTDTAQFPLGPPLVFPPHSVIMHPAPDRFAIVAWASPIRGRVDVNGSFTHLNQCGGGVLWSVDQGNVTLASGVIDRTSQSFHLPRIGVARNDVLYFIVDPNGDYACDSTRLQLTITRGTTS